MYHKATNQDARLKQNKERQFKEPSLTSGRDKHLLDQKKLYGQMKRQNTAENTQLEEQPQYFKTEGKHLQFNL